MGYNVNFLEKEIRDLKKIKDDKEYKSKYIIGKKTSFDKLISFINTFSLISLFILGFLYVFMHFASIQDPDAFNGGGVSDYFQEFEWDAIVQTFKVVLFLSVTSFIYLRFRKKKHINDEKQINSEIKEIDEKITSLNNNIQEKREASRKRNWDLQKKEAERKKLVKERERSEIKKIKENLFSRFDKNKNGTLDDIENNNEFNFLIQENQDLIVAKGKEMNSNYLNQFIKLHNYISIKKDNLQLFFSSIQNINNKKDIEDSIEALNSSIHSYYLLMYNSLILINSLIENDLYTFNIIFEKLDKLNVFNSNWENDLSEKLNTLNDGVNKVHYGITELNMRVADVNYTLKGIVTEIKTMGNKIESSIGNLTSITQESNQQLDSRLKKINSSVDTGNLIGVINLYQNYKLNKRLG